MTHSAAREPAPNREGGRARAKRKQIEAMALGDVTVVGNELLVATLPSGDVDRWRRVDKEWFELVASERGQRTALAPPSDLIHAAHPDSE